LSVLGTGWLANVARGTKGNVQLAVWTERNVLPVVVFFWWQVELGCKVNGRHGGVLVDAIKAQHFVYGNDEQSAIFVSHGRLVKLVNHYARCACGAVVCDFINTA